ncbi:MAG: effector binding domain-containing protein [Bacteroidota bacterium]
MQKAKPRLARLTAILTQLQSKKLLTARAIAEKHQVSIRTIYRDIRTLEQSGIPIITEEGKGYSLMPNYQLPPIMLTEAEANALITAEQLVLKNKDESFVKHYQEAIIKIKATLRSNDKEKVNLLKERIQIRANPKNEKTSNYLVQLQSTITNCNLAQIEYLSLQGAQSHRTIEPFALYSTQSNWILVAFCRKRQDFRAFRLDRIQKLYTQSACFQPHQMTLLEYFEQCREKYENTPDIPLSSDTFTFATSNQNKIQMQKVTIKPFHIIGIAVRTSHEDAMKDITSLWQQWMSQNLAEKIPNKVSPAVYSIYTDYESDYTGAYTTILGCQAGNLDAIPAGMVGHSFDGGTYQKMTAKGDLSEGIVYNAWNDIWKMEKELNRAYTADFEIYGERAMNPSDAEVDIFLAV